MLYMELSSARDLALQLALTNCVPLRTSKYKGVDISVSILYLMYRTAPIQLKKMMPGYFSLIKATLFSNKISTVS